MFKFNTTYLLLFLFSVLVGKATLGSGLSMGESLLGIALVGYCGYLRYLDHHQIKEVEKNYEDRLKHIESKITFMTTGGRLVNRGNERG